MSGYGHTYTSVSSESTLNPILYEPLDTHCFIKSPSPISVQWLQVPYPWTLHNTKDSRARLILGDLPGRCPVVAWSFAHILSAFLAYAFRFALQLRVSYLPLSPLSRLYRNRDSSCMSTVFTCEQDIHCVVLGNFKVKNSHAHCICSRALGAACITSHSQAESIELLS